MGFFDSIVGGAESLGKGVVSAGAGLLGLNDPFAPGMPTLRQAPLDSNAQELLKYQTGKFIPNGPNGTFTTDPNKQIADEYNQNVGASSKFLRGGGVSSPMGDAIAERQARGLGAQTSQMYRSDMANAPATRAAQMSGVLAAVSRNAQQANQFAAQQRLADQNRTFYRNNAINNLFRSGGAVAGAVLGGGQGAGLGQILGGAVGAGISGPTGNPSYIPGGIMQ